jgi:hypothetical protein
MDFSGPEFHRIAIVVADRSRKDYRRVTRFGLFGRSNSECLGTPPWWAAYYPRNHFRSARVGRTLCQRAPIHAGGLGVGTGLRPAVISQWLNQEFDGAPTNVSGSRRDGAVHGERVRAGGQKQRGQSQRCDRCMDRAHDADYLGTYPYASALLSA